MNELKGFTLKFSLGLSSITKKITCMVVKDIS